MKCMIGISGNFFFVLIRVLCGTRLNPQKKKTMNDGDVTWGEIEKKTLNYNTETLATDVDLYTRNMWMVKTYHILQ